MCLRFDRHTLSKSDQRFVVALCDQTSFPRDCGFQVGRYSDRPGEPVVKLESRSLRIAWTVQLVHMQGSEIVTLCTASM